jgi:hypothetical protein
MKLDLRASKQSLPLRWLGKQILRIYFPHLPCGRQQVTTTPSVYGLTGFWFIMKKQVKVGKDTLKL